MFAINRDLDPTAEYSFQTAPSGRTHPALVQTFVFNKRSHEELISVDDGIGTDAKRIWSAHDGWNIQAYADLVSMFILFIDRTQEVNPEFIDAALADDLSVSQAVSSWFEQTDLTVSIEHHAGGSTGMLDIDIQGIGTVRRVVLSSKMKKGDIFNVYYGESSKGGANWNTDLRTTLVNFFQRKAAH